MDDILQRYRNLTLSTHREIETFHKRPEYDTSCVKEALTPILSQCLKKSVNELEPKLRVITAAKLSICEFQVSQVDYPEQCHPQLGYFTGSDKVDYSQCVVALERKSQWWTSYSGYYRSIGDICLQESLPYEKDEIWNLFIDVTEYYEKIFDNLHDYVNMSENFKTKYEESFNVLNKLMQEISLDSESNKDHLDQMWQYITRQLTKISEMSINITDLAKLQTDNLETNLMNFFQKTDLEYGKHLELLKFQFLQDLETKDRLMMDSIMKTQSKLSILNSLTNENYQLSQSTNTNLKSTSQTVQILNESLLIMDGNVVLLNDEIIDAKELMSDINDILSNNFLIRMLLYIFKEINITMESIIIFLTTCSISFMVLIMISLKINLFKYIGIFVVSIICGGMLGSIIMLIGKIVNEQLIHQLNQTLD